ncbi:MAG: choice-of-anchor X domain-containing protein, partial [Wenzhouxiangella sp.]|nr:choice-of-anchor X domain-containing protein [Wenzhouxiangella sp.]
ELATEDQAIFAPAPGSSGSVSDTTTLTLTSTQALDSPVYIYNEFARMKIDGQVLGVIELFDDGTHGDAVAGDLIYSRAGVGFEEASGYSYCDSFTSALLLLGRLSGDEAGIVALPDSQPLIGVSDDYLAVPEVGVGSQWTDHAVNLVMDTEALEGANWIPAVTERFYAEFADRYDFLYLFPDWVFSIGAAFMTVVHNDVEGIGLEAIDRRSEFGSDGPLQGIVASRYSSTPPLLHETMHRWGNYLNPPFRGCCHWLYSSVDGQLGGFEPGTLVDNQDGTYSVQGLATLGYSDDTLPYAPLELYLAGLLSIDSVPAIDIAVNAQPAGAFGTFTADEILQIDGDDLIDQFGPRTPDFASSQKNFKGAFVGISSEPLNQATMTFLDRLSQGFSGTAFGCSTTLDFNEATGGVGSMETLIERVTVFEDRFEDE